MFLAVGTDQGVMVLKPSDNPDAMWNLVSHGQHSRRIGAVVQSSEGSLYVGAAHGTVYRTKDGENWESLVDGLIYTSVHALSMHPDHPKILFAGTQPAAVFRSVDGGAHWEKLASFNAVPGVTNWSYPEAPYRALVTSLLQHPRDPKAVLATVAVGGLIASLDGGQTWAERHAGLGREAYQVAIHPDRPGRVFATTGGGVHRSDDLGATWKAVNQGLPYQFTRCLALDPGNPDRLMVGANQRRDGGAGLVARSSDGGETWQVVATGLPSLQGNMITGLAAAPGLFALGTDQGLLYVTEDFGERWRRIRASSPPVRTLVALKRALG